MKTIKSDINRICLILLGLKGDLFIRIPLIESIKSSVPDAKITVVIDSYNLDVLKNHPSIDKVILFDRRKTRKIERFKNMLKGINELRSYKFDLMINFYSGGSSNLAVLLAKSVYKIGFNNGLESRIANNILIKLPDITNKHFIDYLSYLLQPLGIKPCSVRRGSSFHLDQESNVYANQVLSKYNNDKLIVFNLTTGGKEKTWDVTLFVELSLKLNEMYNTIPVVFTNPGMESVTEEFVSLVNNKIPVVHVPRTPFNKEAAIMSQCYAVITGDTSLMHLAIALKKPTLTIFLWTKPENVYPEDCLYEVCDLRKSAVENNIDDVIKCFTQLDNNINGV